MTTITWGLLGWSNKRSGVEFYRWDEKIIPRHSSDWDSSVRLPARSMLRRTLSQQEVAFMIACRGQEWLEARYPRRWLP